MTTSASRLFGFLRQLGRTQPHAPATTQPAPRCDFAMPLKALAPSAHLDRLSAIVRLSFARVEDVNGTHALARQQLDVADYTLQCILDELRTIMPSQFPSTPKLIPIHATPAYGSAHARMAA